MSELAVATRALASAMSYLAGDGAEDTQPDGPRVSQTTEDHAALATRIVKASEPAPKTSRRVTTIEKIVKALSERGRMTPGELADATGESPSAVSHALTRAKAQGVVRGETRGSWEVVEGASASVPLTDQLVNALAEAGRPMTTIELAEVLGAGHTGLGTNLTRLIRQGRIIKLSPGLYSLPAT